MKVLWQNVKGVRESRRGSWLPLQQLGVLAGGRQDLPPWLLGGLLRTPPVHRVLREAEDSDGGFSVISVPLQSCLPESSPPGPSVACLSDSCMRTLSTRTVRVGWSF